MALTPRRSRPLRLALLLLGLMTHVMTHATTHCSSDAPPLCTQQEPGGRHRSLQNTALPADALSKCRSRYSAFLPGIYEDLLPWSVHGINESLMDRAFKEQTFIRPRKKKGDAVANGIGIVFKGGKPFVVGGDRNAEDAISGPHRRQLVAYGHVLGHLSRTYGLWPAHPRSGAGAASERPARRAQQPPQGAAAAHVQVRGMMGKQIHKSQHAEAGGRLAAAGWLHPVHPVPGGSGCARAE